MEILDPPGYGLIPTWQWLYATWFGAGLVVPLRAGLGVFSVLPVVLLAMRLPRSVIVTAGLVLFALGVYITLSIELATGIKDDRRIIIDEVAAFVLGAAVIRPAGWRMLTVFAASFLFIDRLKPWPLRVVEQLPGGWGVMLDDLVAALMIAFLLLAVRRWMLRVGTD